MNTGTLHVKFFKSLYLTLLISALHTTHLGATENSPAECSESIYLTINSDWREPGDAREQIFQIEMAMVGITAIEVQPTEAGKEAVVIRPRNQICSPATTSNTTLLEHSTNRLLFQSSEPVTYFFSVASQDPKEVLDNFRVTTYFSANPPNSSDGSEPGEDPGEIEIDPYGSGTHAESFGETCQTILENNVDDFSDTFTCAIHIPENQELQGEIYNLQGDDIDIFRVELQEPRTVIFTAQGSLDIVSSLYDTQGQHLGKSHDTDQEGENMDSESRLVKSLVKGVYFIRVESAEQEEGLYTFQLESIPW